MKYHLLFEFGMPDASQVPDVFMMEYGYDLVMNMGQWKTGLPYSKDRLAALCKDIQNLMRAGNIPVPKVVEFIAVGFSGEQDTADTIHCFKITAGDIGKQSPLAWGIK